jgi:hypothetical protein
MAMTSEDFRTKFSQGKIPAIKILYHQLIHCYTIARIFMTNYFVIDVSGTGWGKTYTTTKLTIDALISSDPRVRINHVMIVCGKTLRGNWTEFVDKYSLPVIKIKGESTCTYQSMCGRQGNKTCFDGLLERSNDVKILKNKKEKKITIYRPTEKLKRLVKEGVYFLFDEAYSFANKNSCGDACRAIVKLVKDEFLKGGSSRIFFISATPMNKEEHFWNLLSVYGIINHRKAFQKHGMSVIFEDYAFDNMIIYLMHLLTRSKDILPQSLIENVHSQFDYIYQNYDFPEMSQNGSFEKQRYDQNSVYVKEIMFLIYIKCILPLVQSKMKKPVIDVELDCKNGLYKVPLNELSMINDGIDLLHKAYKRQDEGDNNELGAINSALQKIEIAKKYMYLRLTKKELESDHRRKVVFAVNYLDTLDYMSNELKEYNPLLIQGDNSASDRARVIALFNQPNSLHRVLIFTIATGSKGISLHDLDGRYPRTLFISPNYSFEKMTQTVCRIYRVGSKSDAKVRLVFVDNTAEQSILTNLAKKKKIHVAVTFGRNDYVDQYILEDYIEEDMPFPGGYETENCGLV